MLAVVVTAVWGFNFSVIKFGLGTIDPFVLAGVRFALCALPAVFLVRRPDVPWRYVIGYGLVFGVGLWGLVNLGIAAGVSAGVASLTLQTSAFFTMALGAVVFGESLTRYRIAGAVVALAGLGCIGFVSDGSITVAGLMLVLAGAASWSVANVIVKRCGASDLLSFIVWSSAFSPVPLLVLGAVRSDAGVYVRTWDALDGAAIVAILYQVYPVTIFGYWAWNRLLRQYSLARVAPFSLLVPVFGVCGSVLFFDERLPPVKLTAIGLIVLGLSIGQFGARRRHAVAANLAPAGSGGVPDLSRP
jgi:O-acetylserine/cysteine efflux transporter